MRSSQGRNGASSRNDPIDWIVEVAPWLYYAALPLVCWLVAWLRVTETQVSHGV